MASLLSSNSATHSCNSIDAISLLALLSRSSNDKAANLVEMPGEESLELFFDMVGEIVFILVALVICRMTLTADVSNQE